jgi:HK97 family phage major capsid protein
MDHQNPPAGRGLSLEERDDAAYMAFHVSATQRGDEILTLAADGVATGASVGFFETPGGTTVETRNGRRVRVHRKADLREVSTTWLPTYEQAAVQYVRSQDPPTEVAPMADPEAPPVGATPTPEPDYTALVDRISNRLSEPFDKITDRLVKLEERSRSEIIIPSGSSKPEIPDRGFWMQTVLRMLSGERVPDLQMRTLDDLVTSDNIGVVPPTYSSEIIGVINRRRPFMETTRRIGTPSTGMSLIVPRIVTRPTVAQQAAEKDELDSTATAVDTVTFDAVTKGGAGDISLQLLKRSSPSFLSLYLDLLAEAYAAEAEVEAVEALIDSGSGGFGSLGGVNDGGSFDPEDTTLGDAWLNGYNAMYGGPDTIWLSSAAVGAFIDAKANTTNQPLYSTLVANITAAGGLGGSISGLRPVHVPALNGTAVDVLVGPSNGFAWAEDGTYTLQVDVPAKAGRDVAIVGILWFAPLYPTAFTGWALGGS